MGRDVNVTEREQDPERRHDERRSSGGLFATERANELRSRWNEVQAGFVDDPGGTVKKADALVEEVLRDLAALFADQRKRVDAEIGGKERADTEHQRVAIHRYRSFFERLLGA